MDVKKTPKRKLMPLRRTGDCTILDDDTTTTFVDLDDTAAEKVSCPYRDETKTTPKRSRRRTQTTIQKQVASSKQSGSDAIKRRSKKRINPRNIFERKATSLKIGPSIRSQAQARKRTMVCTRMHREDSAFVSEAIAKLGGWEMEQKVSSQTTHVICGDEKRTVNLLKAIAHGCWILNYDWIRQSVLAGQWLQEEPFEVKAFPGIRQCRIAKETFGTKCSIFKNGDTYYVAPNTRPPRSHLKDLLKLCGAKIVSTQRRGTVIITPIPPADVLPGTIPVTEKWAMDSIVENMLQPKEKYLPTP